ncbi:PEP-CTERM system histidine kinase PrsK [Alteromonas aestuariivivens]|uniref:histidine kinase n=1 Tax=Alteromonas aestuariivivens TaxID=1938339 RepID=A0A3D8MEL9_9ALTE|nr:XrtA/PEP-CTERM system histidine kinase PrsK [Alteromonas aestuariivivens]RDV29050.1 PEP-CTERM system histidine kinase PrsK [Alteromonas aestuariivivens]
MISDIGYALNSLAYLVLLLLLFTVRKAGLAKYLLMIATMATLAWSLGYISLLFGPATPNYMLTADALRQLVWLLFIASCLRDDFTDLWQVLRRPATHFILLPALLALILPQFMYFSATWRYLFQTVLALEGLILLEVLYRQSGGNQWSYKPLVVYLGATQLFEFVTYANATMINQIEPGYLAARGYIYVLLLPLLVVAIRRIRHWGVDIFISRDVVLHSSLLLVAGAYLFIMALIGYVINYLGGNWGATVQIVLMVLSLALLASLVLSNSLRTRIKVFITKHFFANQYDYRVEWVKLTQSLSVSTNSMPEVYRAALDGMLGAISYSEGKLVKVAGHELDVLASVGSRVLTDAERTILNQLKPYCGQTQWLIDIDEYQVKPFSYNGLQLDRALLQQCEFQLVLPVFNEGQLWGFVCMRALEAEAVSLNWEVRDYLTAVTDQVTTYILHHEAAQTVAENAQFAAFSRMSAFILHDLKNVMAQIDLILCNAEQHKDNPEFIEDTFETLHYTKARMDKMLRQLTEKKVQQPGANSAHSLKPLIEKVVAEKCQAMRPEPQICGHDDPEVVVDPEKFSNVIYHLVSNAQQATEDEGDVRIELQLDPLTNRQLVHIRDSGCGMDQAFIQERLFKPFDTTKGNAGMGIGAYDARHYMESIGGRLSVDSEPGKGSCFTLAFPLD